MVRQTCSEQHFGGNDARVTQSEAGAKSTGGISTPPASKSNSCPHRSDRQILYRPVLWRLSTGGQTARESHWRPMQPTPGRSWCTLKHTHTHTHTHVVTQLLYSVTRMCFRAHVPHIVIFKCSPTSSWYLIDTRIFYSLDTVGGLY